MGSKLSNPGHGQRNRESEENFSSSGASIVPRIRREKLNSAYAREVTHHFQLTQKAQKVYDQIQSQGENSRSSLLIVPKVNGLIYQIKEKKATYQGSFASDQQTNMKLPHGNGVMFMKSGSFYGGDFVNGEAHGRGIYIFPDGSYYSGAFNQGRFNGYGVLTYKDAIMQYLGQFKDGHPHGQGHEIYNDQSKYIGFFSNGKREGNGEYYWGSRSNKKELYIGEFSDNQMNGKGVITNLRKDEIIFYGTYHNGKKNGKGILKTGMGSMAGEFKDDLLNGQGSFYWKDGSKAYIGSFVDSKMHGNGQIYYNSNQYAAGEWAQGHSIRIQQLKNDQVAKQKLESVRKEHEKLFKEGFGRMEETKQRISEIDELI